MCWGIGYSTLDDNNAEEFLRIVAITPLNVILKTKHGEIEIELFHDTPSIAGIFIKFTDSISLTRVYSCSSRVVTKETVKKSALRTRFSKASTVNARV